MPCFLFFRCEILDRRFEIGEFRSLPGKLFEKNMFCAAPHFILYPGVPEKIIFKFNFHVRGSGKFFCKGINYLMPDDFFCFFKGLNWRGLLFMFCFFGL